MQVRLFDISTKEMVITEEGEYETVLEALDNNPEYNTARTYDSYEDKFYTDYKII